MNKANPTDLILVFQGNPMEAEMIRELLTDNDIPVNLKNPLMGSIAPWQVKAGGLDPVDVEVLQKDEAKARALIREFHQQS